MIMVIEAEIIVESVKFRRSEFSVDIHRNILLKTIPTKEKKEITQQYA